MPRSLKSTTTQPAVGGPKTFREDQRAGDLKKKVANVEIYVIFEVFAFCGGRTKTDFKDRADTALQCLTISMLSRHQRTLSTHARFVNPCLGFNSRKKKLQLKRTHLHQQCWTRRLHACSPRRVRARRSQSAWRDRNPCSPARRSLPLDAPGTWTENSDETQSQSREFKRNIFQRAHDNSYLLTSV